MAVGSAFGGPHGIKQDMFFQNQTYAIACWGASSFFFSDHSVGEKSNYKYSLR